MTGLKKYLFVGFAAAFLSGLTGCVGDECTEEEFKSLLMPADDEESLTDTDSTDTALTGTDSTDTALKDTNSTDTGSTDTALTDTNSTDTESTDTDSTTMYTAFDGGITCLTELAFVDIKKRWPTEVVESDYAVTDNTTYGGDKRGDYFAGALIVRTLAAYNGLINLGCLSQPAVPLNIDWTSQTLVVMSVKSRDGCPVSAVKEIHEQSDGIARLTDTVEFIPKGGCRFEYGETFVVNQLGAKARMSLNTTCSSD